MRWHWFAALAAIASTIGVGPRSITGDRSGSDTKCITCHAGIEEMHPGFPLSCVDCHGGDGNATAKEKAHVAPSLPRPADLIEMIRAREQGESIDEAKFQARVRSAVAETVQNIAAPSRIASRGSASHGSPRPPGLVEGVMRAVPWVPG